MPLDHVHTMRRVSVTMLVALSLAGCALGPMPSAEQASSSTVGFPPANHPDPVLTLLDYARELESASPDQRADHVEAARHAVAEHETAYRCARLALAYGTPNQRRYTPDEAARYARLALDKDNAHWSPAARQYLTDYARLYKEVTNAKQPAETDDNGTEQVAVASDEAHNERVDELRGDQERARIAQLEAELHEAHRKLREMANIEDRLGDTQP